MQHVDLIIMQSHIYAQTRGGFLQNAIMQYPIVISHVSYRAKKRKIAAANAQNLALRGGVIGSSLYCLNFCIIGSELILDDLGEEMGDEKPLSLDFLGCGQVFSLGGSP